MEVYYETVKRMLAPYRQEARKWAGMGRSPLGQAKYEVVLAAMEEALFDVAKQGVDLFNIELPFTVGLLGQVYRQILSTGPTVESRIPDANSFITEAWQRACVYAAGEKVFEVSPALSDHLWATDVRNVQCDMLKLPFKSLYIRVPRNSRLIIPAPLAVNIASSSGIEPTGECRVEGMFITESNVPNTDHDEIVPESTQRTAGLRTRRSWVFTIVAEGGPKKAGVMDDKTFYVFEFPLPQGATVQDAISIRNQSINSREFKAKYRADAVWEKFFEWAMNVMLYVTYEPNPDIEEVWANKDALLLKRRIARMPDGKEKKRLKERLKGMDEQRRIYVGRHHCLLEDAEHVEGVAKEGVPLTVRILVTGHWRHQAYGTGWQDHKLIWIRPHWKGPKGAPISNPRRIVT